MDYKKILEGVVDIINTAEKSDIGFANICTYIGEKCPELAESEDEKIRKELIDIVTKSPITFAFEDKGKVLAWLEKQGNANKEYWRGYREGKKEILDKYSELEKQGEQKQKQYDIDVLEKHITKDSISELAHTVIVRNGWEIVDAKEALLDETEREALRTEYEKGRTDAIAEMQKEWSEEDKTGLVNTIIMLKEGASHHFSKKDITNAVDWLKSLKQRIGG